MKCPYPEPPDLLRRPRFRHILRYLGPGVVIASVTIGSGELVFASRSGALFGYTMLWCFFYAGLFKAVQVYGAARHITLTGEHPLVGWSKPWYLPVFPILIAVPAILLMPIAFSAIPEILGTYSNRIFTPQWAEAAPLRAGPFEWNGFEFSVNTWSTAILTVCLMLAVGSTYSWLEKISTVVLGAMVVAVAITVIVMTPNLLAILRGLLQPAVNDFEPWVLEKYPKDFVGRSPWLEVSLYLSAVGGGAYDYIGYIGMMREKRWGLAGGQVASRQELELAVSPESPVAAETLERARIWQRAPFLDTTISFSFVVLVTLLFAILAAMVLHPTQTIPVNSRLLFEQEQFLAVQLQWLYRLSVFLAFIGTLYGAFEVYQHTFVESLRGMIPRLAEGRERFWRLMTVCYCFFGGVLMIWLPESAAGSVVGRLTLGSLVGGAASCGLWCFAMLWLDSWRLPRPLRMSWLLWIATLIAGSGMLILGVTSIVAYFLQASS